MSRVLKLNKLLVVMVGLVSALTASLTMAALEDEIRARLQPAGQVCVLGQECAAGMLAPGAVAAGPKVPSEVYQTYCFACHGSGANNAPIYGNADNWADRIGKGTDVLYGSAINGFNNGLMPAKGLCMDCSDDDLKAAVDYLLEAVQ